MNKANAFTVKRGGFWRWDETRKRITAAAAVELRISQYVGFELCSLTVRTTCWVSCCLFDLHRSLWGRPCFKAVLLKKRNMKLSQMCGIHSSALFVC